MEDDISQLTEEVIEERSRHIWQYLLLLFNDPANKSQVPLNGLLYRDLSHAIGKALFESLCEHIETLVLPNAEIDLFKNLGDHQIKHAQLVLNVFFLVLFL